MHALIFQAHHTHLSTGLHPKKKEKKEKVCGQFFQSSLIKGEEYETCLLCLQRAVATKFITKVNTYFYDQQPSHCLQNATYHIGGKNNKYKFRSVILRDRSKERVSYFFKSTIYILKNEIFIVFSLILVIFRVILKDGKDFN